MYIILQTALLDHVATLNSIEANEFAAVQTAQSSMLTSVQSLKTTSDNVPTQITTLITTVESTQTQLQLNGVNIVKNVSVTYDWTWYV